MKTVPAQRSGKKRNTYKTKTSKAKVKKRSVPAFLKKKSLKKMKKYVFSTVTVIFIVLISIVFVGAFSFYKYINQNFVSASSSLSDISLKEDEIVSLAYIVVNDLKADPVEMESVNLMIFNRNYNKLRIYDVPLDTVVDIPGNFGENIFSKVFALGGLNSENVLEDGTLTVTQTLKKYFGFKVDRFMVVSSDHKDLFDEIWQTGKIMKIMEISKISDFDENLYTNLDIKELYNLLQFVSVLPGDRIFSYVISQNEISSFDDSIREETLEYYLARERKNIALLNGTGMVGIASFGSRTVENLGGRVVETDNAKSKYEKSTIITKDPESFSVKILQDVFLIDEVVSPAFEGGFRENVVDRADITVIFGLDMEGILY